MNAEALLARCSFPLASSGIYPCAVSGGADSLALLVLARRAGLEVVAHHVDHGLRRGSASEAEVVAAAAERYGAGFVAHQLRLDDGPNLEARARAARYGVLPAEVATGHTADDQAETVLLALLRGSTWEGLGGMRHGPRRPILGLRRAETVALCAAEGLAPVHDPSNDDPRHRRNRVRHELLPLLADIADRDPVAVLARQAVLFREAATMLDDTVAELDPTDAVALREAAAPAARWAIRRWLQSAWPDEAPPDLATVDRVLAVARGEAAGADLRAGWSVRRTHQRLRLVPPTDRAV
jgi:tRNA(Ile)-lysidine synthase